MIAAPQLVTAANHFSLVGVNLRGEERPLVDIPEKEGSWAPSALDTGYFAWPKVSPDGKRVATAEASGPADAPEALGQIIAAALREQGADAILAACVSHDS